MADNNWKCPPRDSKPDEITAWVNREIKDGDAYLQAQRWFKDLDRAIAIICGDSNSQPIPRLSHVQYNKIKRIVRERVSTLSSFRSPPEFEAGNRADEHTNSVLNKLMNAWWYRIMADRSIRTAEQWAEVGGLGWIWPVWTKDFPIFGQSDIELKILGPRDVRVIQMGREHDIQKAYAVIITDEMPIARAHAIWPSFADQLIPDRDRASWLARTARAVKKWASPALNIANQQKTEDEAVFPTIDIHYVYVNDTTINESGETIQMGEPDTSWYYEVPSLNSDLPTGNNDTNGQPTFRKATAEDAMLYPMKRLIVVPGNNKDLILNDGPAPDWHGLFPVIPVTNDDWPFMMGGFSAIHDVWSLQYSIEKDLRACDDQVEIKLDPALLYDKNQIGKADAERLTLRKAKVRVGYDPMGGEPIKTVVPLNAQDVPGWVMEGMKGKQQMMDYLAGTQDVEALMKARIAGADGMEKYLQAIGPIILDMTRQQEKSIRDFAEMVKSMFFQWYRADRRLKILGTDGLTQEDYEYKAGEMLPEPSPGEPRLSTIQRARKHMAGFYANVMPGSLHKIAQMTQQLMYMQLKLRNIVPLDWWTLAKVFNIANFGKPPDGCNTVFDRWQAQVMLEKAMAEELGGGQQPAGRTPSGNKPPQQKNRGGGNPHVTQQSR
jgi:hypothetical protein